MSAPPRLAIDFPSDPVALMTLRDPATLNAFSLEMLDQLAQALEEVDANPDVGCLLITGEGRGFSSGGNVNSMAAAPETVARPIDGYRAAVELLRRRQERTIRRLYQMNKPTIALVNGPAAGAGMALACACDFRLAGESAFFTAAFSRIGRSGDFGLPWFLSRLVGSTRAREICFSSRLVSATEAKQIGLVSEVCTDGGLQQAGLEFAKTLAHGPREAVGRMKQAFRLVENGSLDDVLEFEAWNMPLADNAAEGDEFMAQFLASRGNRGAPLE